MPAPSPPDSGRPKWWTEWFVLKTSARGGHFLILLDERLEDRSVIIDALSLTVKSHYLDPALSERRLAELGAPETAKLFREHLPVTKMARSGDLGEILATEVAERQLGYSVPIRRLRWKDGRNMALRGDDIIGLIRSRKHRLRFLKGESKSRAALTTAVIDEAAEALDREKGRPTRHTVLFIAERLREQGGDDLAIELEQAVLQSFHGHNVEHLLFVLTGNNPENLLSQHLAACGTKPQRRYVAGIRIKDHAKFIEELFKGL